MNCCKKTAVKNIHRSFYVIEFIMCRFPLLIIRCAWYFSAIMRDFWKGFRIGLKIWYNTTCAIASIICVAQLLG